MSSFFNGDCGQSQSPHSRNDLDPVVVVGFSLRFPQDATSPDTFWQMLYEGRSALTEIPPDRFNIDAFYHPDSGRISSLNARGGHFVRNIAAFDAPFFSITPGEAASMDPQQRLLLETTFTALENSGTSIQEVKGSKTAVHVGCFTRDYDQLSLKDPESQPRSHASGSSFAMLANRLSWYYNLMGPSMVVDTACSSSLTALHLSCESLKRRESDMGIVAGCNLIINPDTSISLSNSNFLSPDSRSYSFDHRANGYARGEGVGVVLIKRLADALRDGDTIRAVIRATGVNQDGRTPIITQPSHSAQEQLIRSTYTSAGLTTSETRYFEAHGTGTAAGDPVEAAAIASVFATQRSKEDPLYIGAVKSNIGHLEGASGVAGLIKTILVLEKGIVPPNARFERVNPKIPAEEWNLMFPTVPIAWPSNKLRRASVNSFGFGGANCHVVMDDAYAYLKLHCLNGRHNTVEPQAQLRKTQDLTVETGNRSSQAPTTNRVKPVPLPKVIVWSAADEAGLNRIAKAYSDDWRPETEYSAPSYISDLAYTLAKKRDQLPWKSYALVEAPDELHGLEQTLSKPIRSKGIPRLGFIFSGQGAAWPTMGRELLAYPIFEESLHKSEECLKSLGFRTSILGELRSEAGYGILDHATESQSLSTATQIALVDLLCSWDVCPATVVGHSSGEIAAAYCLGSLDRVSALRVAYYRGLLAEHLVSVDQEHGAMASIGLSEPEAEVYLQKMRAESQEQDISIGCVNSPTNVTLTGKPSSVESIISEMERNKIFARRLSVNVAYHSKSMKLIATEYSSLLQYITCDSVRLEETKDTTMISTVSGELIPNEKLSHADYWVNNLVSPVRFSQAMLRVCSQQPHRCVQEADVACQSSRMIDVLLEVGPHAAMRNSVKDVLEKIDGIKDIHYNSILVRRRSAAETALRAVGDLVCRGYQVALQAVNTPDPAESKVKMLVNLPEYPFNHSHDYWLESQQSANLRFRKHPRHELLGVKVPDWNELEPKWRNFLSVSDNPWIRDHAVNGIQLYPAAGMLVMALEAARQITDTTQVLRGFEMKEISFSKALLVPSTDQGIETNVYLRPRQSEHSILSEWSGFRICSYQDNKWVENCSGSVRVQYEKQGSNRVNDVEAALELKQRKLFFQNRTGHCKETVSTIQLYDILRDSGYQFGPAFQVLREIKYGQDNQSASLIDLDDIFRKDPGYQVQDHLIHPTSLDGILQTASVILTKGGKRSVQSVYPTWIEKLWISGSFCNEKRPQTIKTSAISRRLGFREVATSISAIDLTTEKLCVTIDGFQATSQTNLDYDSYDQLHQKRLCYNIDWKPDLDLIDHDEVSQHSVNAADYNVSPDTATNRDLELVCAIFVGEVIAKVQASELQPSKSHLQKYYRWMEQQVQQLRNEESLDDYTQWKNSVDSEELKEKLFTRLENANPSSKLVVTVGQQIPAILRGETDPLDLLFNTDLASNAYQYMAKTDPNYVRLAVWLDALAHKYPGMRILEIGAGTGGTTEPVLRALSHKDGPEGGVPRFREYTFTDISPGFFEKAKIRFQRWSDRTVFRLLDIENDPLAQGYELGAYDIVIAANVLHATANLQSTVRNTRKLLKPGGKLILFEQTNLELRRLSFAFGSLPGWWLSTENYRQSSPLVTRQRWHEILSSNGFTGNDMALPDYTSELDHLGSLIISTALEHSNPAMKRYEIIIIISKPSKQQQRISEMVARRLENMPFCQRCNILDARCIDARAIEQKFCVFLPEIDCPYLFQLDSDQLGGLKEMVYHASGILWVSSAMEPDRALVEGLARCIRAENSHLTLVTFAIEDPSRPERNAENIIKILSATLKSNQTRLEFEYAERDQRLQISRVVEDRQLDQSIFASTSSQDPVLRSVGSQTHRNLKLSIAVPGLLDTMQFVDETIFGDEIDVCEVEVQVLACGINFKDIMISLGQIPGDCLGSEFAGVVTEVGRNVDHVKLGARVCGFAIGTFRQKLRTRGDLVVELPDELNLTTAAGIPTVYCTAYHALVNVARLTEGESILIHCAAGGVGQAAVQLAHLLKAEIFATVGNEDKKALLMDVYGISSDHIFSSRSTAFAHGVQRMTQERGVDVILNSLAGEGLQESWECVAPLGRFIELGLKDIYSHDSLPMSPFSKSASFTSINGAAMISHKPALLGRNLKAVINLFRENKITGPHPQHLYPISDIVNAFRYLQGGKNTGKTSIEIHESDLIPVAPDISSRYRFRADATYVIAGGFGGLGRSIARWVVKRGAKHLILLSRQGPTSAAASELMDEMKDLGIKVAAPACDASSADSLSKALESCNSMPAIKGCFQGSLVLKDAIFENLTLSNFHTVLAPKVNGSWNLHTHLPSNMDFFILLSSVAGVTGKKGQSNYCSGNTYQDALARHRTRIGQKAISIDLPRVASVGFIAERLDTVPVSPEYAKIQESELHALLEYYCDPALPVQEKSQLVLGIHTPAELARLGIPEPVWMQWPLMRHLHVSSPSPSSSSSLPSATADFSSAPTQDALAAAICQALVHRLAASLSVSTTDIDAEKPMHVYGIDSLVAVEIRQWFRTEVGAEVGVGDVFECGSVRELAGVAAGRSRFLDGNGKELDGDGDEKKKGGDV